MGNPLPPPPVRKPASRRVDLAVQFTILILALGTIAAYICVWRFASDFNIFVHVLFIFIFIGEVSLWERWRATQVYLRSEWAARDDMTQHRWAPWNDPELQARVLLRQRAGEFEPECPADFVAPPAYGNVRGSVLLDPFSGRAIRHERDEMSSVQEEQGIINADGDLVLPDYDALSIRSSWRSSLRRGGPAQRDEESAIGGRMGHPGPAPAADASRPPTPPQRAARRSSSFTAVSRAIAAATRRLSDPATSTDQPEATAARGIRPLVLSRNPSVERTPRPKRMSGPDEAAAHRIRPLLLRSASTTDVTRQNDAVKLELTRSNSMRGYHALSRQSSLSRSS